MRVLSDALKKRPEVFFNSWVRNNLFLKNVSEVAVSYNVLYYHQLSIARYRVSFYAEQLF